MTPERWQQIDQLFHAALACESAQRAQFLATQCGNDESMYREVESLLSSLEDAVGFIETPAGDLAAELLRTHQPTYEPGEQIENYKIVRQLGSGGMGEVYLAEDLRLNRKIALKLLPSHFTVNPDRVRRFEREARAASALNHPNIVTIYEIGHSNSTHFIATEFVDGKTLRQLINERPCTLKQALNVAIQIADALSGAHSAGIVHRDIKPENIMIRTDGYVKILDFGLAKLAEQQTTNADLETPTLLQSNPGLVMGTVHYMSPEQARGNNVGVRTDIWSLGVVLYELLVGHVPFSGETPSHVMVALMEEELPPLAGYANVPAELDRIVTKALSKNQKERYQTARQLAHDLKKLREDLQLEARSKEFLEAVPDVKERTGRIGVDRRPAQSTRSMGFGYRTSSTEYLVGQVKPHKTLAVAASLILLIGVIGLTYLLINRSRTNSSAGARRSIAVLPLKPIDAASRNDTYEIGIADSLINRLGSVKGFIIRPLSATRKYADVEPDPIAAGKEQQVDYVLASNYQLANGKIRVTAQLVNVITGQIEETYKSEADAGNIFAMQDAIAGALVNKLMARFSLTPGRSTAKRGTTNEEAYRLYLQGKYLTMRRNAADAKKAIEYFEQAIRLDPNYALAYAGAARASPSSFPGGDGFNLVENEKVKEHIKKALELDSTLAEAYVARAELALKYGWDFPVVEKDLATAIELEPHNDSAHWVYALLLAYRGRFDEALGEMETAQAIDPGALMYMRDRGRILYYARRYDEAIEQLKRVIDLDENMGAGWLRFAYGMKGDHAKAFEVFIKNQKRWNPDRVEIYRKTYETDGWPGVRRKILELAKLNEQKPGSEFYQLAILSAHLGEKDQAFEYLNKAVEKREWWIVMMNVDPPLDPLRDDPRFGEMVRRIGLNR